MDMETLQYPIGRFLWNVEADPDSRQAWLKAIEDTPAELQKVVSDLTEQQLDTPYRPDGWTVRQVVHHYADDHLNSYVRFKWALTEDSPTIKGYDQTAWGDLTDARQGAIQPSLALLTALHERWLPAWRALDEAGWRRSFVHPTRGPVTLAQLARLYAWHGRHHVAQVRALRRSKGW